MATHLKGKWNDTLIRAIAHHRIRLSSTRLSVAKTSPKWIGSKKDEFAIRKYVRTKVSNNSNYEAEASVDVRGEERRGSGKQSVRE